MNLERVIVIIPEYGKRSLTQKCIRSIHQEDVPISIFVGNDAYPKPLEPLYDCIVINQPENLGFATNVNITTSFALSKFEDLSKTAIVILNNDTEMVGNCITQLAQKAADFGGIWGPAIEVGEYYYNPQIGYGPHRQMHGPGAFKNLPSNIIDRGLDIPLDMISGCCICMMAEVWLELGGFDCFNFRAYYEDDDICIRAKVLGWPVHLHLGSKLKHQVSSSYRAEDAPIDAINMARISKINFIHKWPEVEWSPTGIYKYNQSIECNDARLKYRGINHSEIFTNCLTNEKE